MKTDHGCRLPRLRWVGREWRCRCGQEWCYIVRGTDRFWARWHNPNTTLER
jgi:hypothetical protein